MTRNPSKQVLGGFNLLEYETALKFSCASDGLQNWAPKFLKKKNLTAISLILIQEYGQSNAILVFFRARVTRLVTAMALKKTCGTS